MKRVIFLIIFIIIIIVGYVYFDLNQNKIDFHEVKNDIIKNNSNYIEVNDSVELLNALENPHIQIINIVSDIDLGYQLVEKSKYIENHCKAVTHPILKDTGVSKLLLKNMNGLIIESSNGSKLLHTNIVIENSKNIEIKNIELDELWEWDEDTFAEYDRNDWDAITIKNSENILIDHITFHKVYDGITDIKNSNNITIKNCKLEKLDIDNDSFFNSQFDVLESNRDNYPMYQYLRDEVGLSVNEVKLLSSYQYKLFLIGPKDFGEKNKNIVIHDNMFLNVKTRVPQARNSSVYFYNNYIDSSDIGYDVISKKQKEMINHSKYQKLVHLGTYGIISIQRSYVVSENNIFKGVDFPYTNGRDNKYKNIGRIIINEDKDVLLKLKEKLDNNVGAKK